MKKPVILTSEILSAKRDEINASIDVAIEIENIIERYESWKHSPIVSDETGEVIEDLSQWEIDENKQYDLKIEILNRLLKSL